MALLSALYHEGQAKQKASEELRKSKYGGDQTADTLIDLCEPSIPGVLMKKIVRGGNGEIPPVGVNVRVHYTGKLKDGTEFDTSAGRGPISFRLGKGEVIRGWDLAASTMQKGERCILTVGPEYGYKASGAGPIPPNATLIFEMEMMDWDEPSADGIKIYQWIGAVVVMCMIYYVLYVDDEEDIARRAQEL